MAENKKDSFTFSDKIKNSKPAFNPFSKRVSSKIGSNGKPKKTLFERTRRDAPFFVAAAAALLMLPFLYKYSGSMNEEVIVPPGSEDSVFDPERYGFNPSNEDPNGQIAQMAGRDPLSLIKGWGSAEPEEEPPMYDADRRDGLDDAYTPSAPTASDSPRAYAPAATRAAFQRTPTKIKELGSASMNLRGGGGGFGRFGGANLKRAASKNSAGAPRQGTKPVSLQPLRAADKPSRSYFGQSSAAQARASRDAMGKADAKTALRDAMFRPVETGRLGGLGTGDFASGGGSGKLDITHDYKGITPWWWDMMKERAQKKWEWKYFLWRKNLVEPLIKKLGEMIAEFAGGLTCCILTGEDDCSMGSMWGTSAAGGTPAGCKIAGADPVDYATYCAQFPKKDDPYGLCGNDKTTFKNVCKQKAAAGERKWEWVDAKGAGGNLGFFGKRAYCLGNSVKGASSKAVKDRFDCEAVDTTHNFELQTSGKANGWHKYHAIVVKNYVPFDNAGTHYLCGMGNKNANKQSVAAAENAKGATGDQRAQAATKNAYSRYAADNYDGLQRDDVNDACVIYVAQGPALKWQDFKAKTMDVLGRLGLKKNGKPVTGEEAFKALQLYFIEGYAFKQPMSKGGNKTQATNANGQTVRVKDMPVDVLPMAYVDFESYYVLRRKNDSKEDSAKLNDKWRVYESTFTHVDGSTRTTLAGGKKVDSARAVCEFARFHIKAETIETPSLLKSMLTFDPKVHGAAGEKIKVKLAVHDVNGNKLFETEQTQAGEAKNNQVGVQYAPNESQQQLMQKAGEIDARWTATFAEKESKDNTGYIPVPPEQAAVIEPVGGDDGTEIVQQESDAVNAEGKGAATTFAYRLKDIPATPSQRQKLAEEYLTIPATKATLAEMSEQARRKAQGDAEAKIENGGNVLAGAPLYGDAAIADCLPNATDNIVVQSVQAQKFMNAVKNQYNQKYADNPIVYSRTNPSIANLIDAAHIAVKEGFSTSIPKAAVCQLGRIMSTVAKDETMEPRFRANKDGLPYNNTFGAFATYIGQDSVYFPADTSTDSGYPYKKGSYGLNPRFHGYNPRLTSYEYHYGNYVWKGAPSRTFLSDMNKRASKAGNGDLYPLKDLSRTKDASWNNAKTVAADAQNRRTYWNAYGPLYKAADGCDTTYGSETMSATEAMRYLEMVCRVGLKDKPRSGTQKVRSSAHSATGAGRPVAGVGHNTATQQASK